MRRRRERRLLSHRDHSMRLSAQPREPAPVERVDENVLRVRGEAERDARLLRGERGGRGCGAGEVGVNVRRAPGAELFADAAAGVGVAALLLRYARAAAP